MRDTRVVTHIYLVRYQIYVTNKNENGGLRILFEKVYVLRTVKYEVKIVQLYSGKIIFSVLVRPKRAPVHLSGFSKLPAPVKYQVIKDLVANKMSHILDQI